MKEENQNVKEREIAEDQIDFRALLFKYIIHWPWFVGAVLLCLVGAWFYLHWATPIYNISATVLIKDEKKGGGAGLSSELEDMGLSGLMTSSKNIDNELEVLRSKTLVNIRLPLGTDFGGPLFFTHYSYLGLDPRGLKDSYADYGEQMKAHTLINRAYCIDNPKKYKGYGRKCWGLTASDNHQGYSAHCPQNDLGVITPTAAISSIPYTPEHSLEAMRYFYEELGDRLWGKYGFKDAFNLTENWFASSYLAIDQGPIIVMIENYRSGLIWKLFMSHPDVQRGLKRLGFGSEE